MLHVRGGLLLLAMATFLLAMLTPAAAQAAGEQFNVSASSGRPGVAVLISQGDPCPTVGDYTQRVLASFTDAAGTTTDFSAISDADPPGNWNQTARVTIPVSAAQGVGSLTVRCAYWDGTNEITSLQYTPRAYTVAGTPPQFTSSPASVLPGQAVTLMSTDPCPSDRIQGSIFGGNQESNFYQMLDASGAWVVGVPTSSETMGGPRTPFAPGTYTIQAYCLDDATAHTTQVYVNQQVVVGETPPPVSNCRDVLILAVAGSGQHYDGPTNLSISPELKAVRKAFLDILPPERTVKTRVINYPAEPVETLTRHLKLKQYMDGKNQGVRRLFSEVVGATFECPNQALFLIGFSQGALVVHEFLGEYALVATQAELDVIASVVLVADPARHANSPVVTFGDAPFDSKGVCQFLGGDKCFKDIPFADVPQVFVSKTWGVCNSLDIVCDTSHLVGVGAIVPKDAYEVGVRVHSSYHNSPNTRTAGKRAARQVMQRWQ